MASFAIRWVAIFLAVLVAGAVFQGGIVYQDLTSAAVFAVVLALLNAVVRPLVSLIALPITCLTLGLFTVVVNGLMFWMASGLVPGIRVESFGLAILGALVVSAVNVLVSMILGSDRDRR